MCNESERGFEAPGRAERELFGSVFTRLWRVAGLPALIYLGVALGMPLANGAAEKHGMAFWEHAAATCATLVMLVGLLIVLEAAWTRVLAKVRRRG